LLGSVAEGVVHSASRPVLVARGGEQVWPPERIVIGDDNSEVSRSAGKLAACIGSLFGPYALLVGVYPELPKMDIEERQLNARMVDDELRREEEELEGRAAVLEKYLGERPKIRLSVGDPAERILKVTEEEGDPEKVLIAVGSRGLRPLKRMRLGSVSTKVLRAAKGPVLVHPAPQS